jgi:hypothetical protein
MRTRSTFLVVVAAILLVACKDKAEPDYAACVQADTAGDVGKAWDSCTAAVGADPNSTSGKAAAAKLTAMKPAYDKWKADQNAKAAAAAAAQAKADEERAKAEAQEHAKEVAALRAKIHRAYDGRDPDGECQSNGYPPYREDYTGGSYDENETVALGDGCVHLFQKHSMHSPNDNTYCCPK